MKDKPAPVLPLDFIRQMEELLPNEEFPLFIESLKSPSPVSIRINPFKAKTSHFPNSLPIPWARHGYRLSQRPDFTNDPYFHAGAYYVQEASSTFLQWMLEQLSLPKGSICLDLCAAPGGKSTLLSSFLGSDGLLIANEVIKNRTQILKENMIKWGLGNTIVTQNDPAHFSGLEESFDLILADAPCSGEGMFRKDPVAIREWSAEQVKLCGLRQKRILEEAVPLLRPGGYLIYSTCTFNRTENDTIVSSLIQKHGLIGVRVPVNDEWGIEEDVLASNGKIGYAYRFFPHKVTGEGLFISLFQKPGALEHTHMKWSKNFNHPHIKPVSAKQFPAVFSFAKDAGLDLFQVGNSYFAFPENFVSTFEIIADSLNIKYFGTELGELIRESWIPSHPLALSILPKERFERAEIDLETALNYLKKKEITLDQRIRKGWVLLHYDKLALGWCKNLGNRINNYYPKAWRVRKD